MNRKLIQYLVVAFFGLTSCKVEKLGIHNNQKIPPQFNASSTDSSSVGKVMWRQFFQDPILVALIDTTLVRNQDLKIALENIRKTSAVSYASRAGLLPSLALNARAGRERFGDYTMNGVGNFDTNLSENVRSDQRIPSPTPDYFIGAATTWEIDIWGKLRKLKKRDQIRFLASEHGRRAVQTALVYQVAHHYYELLALDQELTIIRNNIKLQGDAVSLMEIQKEAGKVTQVAVDQVKAQHLNTQALEYGVLQTIVEHENALSVLQGRFEFKPQRNKALDDQRVPAQVSAGIPQAVMERRPDVTEARLQWLAHVEDVGAARAAFYPSLSLSAFAGFNAFDTRFLFETPASLVHGFFAGLTAPVFQRNQLKSNYRFATAEERQAYYHYERTVLSAYAEVVNELSRVDNLRKSAELKTQEVDRLRSAVSNVNQLFGAGYASYLEVITAQQNLLEAELDLAILKKDQLVALSSVYKAVGGGWQ